MTCSERIVELVECARRHTEPDRELRAHLSFCSRCSERWDREQQLTDQFQAMRAAVRSSDDFGARATNRESLMRDFARIHPPRVVPFVSRQTWVWASGVAAALVFAIFLGQAFLGNTRRVLTRKAVPATVRIADESAIYETSADASALSSDDFIAIPYTPPLAPGEMVRVVHADLYPEALASMGVEVDPSWAGNLPADVVVGEDGLPRAVRITENAQF